MYSFFSLFLSSVHFLGAPKAIVEKGKHHFEYSINYERIRKVWHLPVAVTLFSFLCIYVFFVLVVRFYSWTIHIFEVQNEKKNDFHWIFFTFYLRFRWKILPDPDHVRIAFFVYLKLKLSMGLVFEYWNISNNTRKKLQKKISLELPKKTKSVNKIIIFVREQIWNW